MTFHSHNTCRYFLLKHQCLGTGTVLRVDLRWTSNLGSSFQLRSKIVSGVEPWISGGDIVHLNYIRSRHQLLQLRHAQPSKISAPHSVFGIFPDPHLFNFFNFLLLIFGSPDFSVTWDWGEVGFFWLMLFSVMSPHHLAYHRPPTALELSWTVRHVYVPPEIYSRA